MRVITGDKLDPNTAQTPGMFRQAAINHARVGAQKIWAGTVHIHPNAKTGAHHHGALESVIYIVSGRARMRWGEKLEFVAEAGPGDFIFVPPYVPHQEINASTDETLRCVLGTYLRTPANRKRPPSFPSGLSCLTAAAHSIGRFRSFQIGGLSPDRVLARQPLHLGTVANCCPNRTRWSPISVRWVH